MNRRLYLDHAATRFPKPSVVIETMRSYSTDQEAALGRGVYRSAQNASNVVAQLRHELARWIDADSGDEISLHPGGTEAINTALLGTLRPGDHVVTTAAEHNSVLRPLHHLESNDTITLEIVPVNQCGIVSPADVLSAIRPETRLVAVVHAVNVNGAVQPIREIGTALTQKYSRDEKPILMTDAAQSFGHLPLSVSQCEIDLLAAPGHKGGCGPLGTGFLYARKEQHDAMHPILFGGTGTQSESLEMPTDYPSAFEAGNMNVPAMAGWLAGLRERHTETSPWKSVHSSAESLSDLARELYELLDQINGVTIIGQPETLALPVASVSIDGMDPSEAAMILDAEFGIEVRSGLHCAALIHQAIGSPAGGTLRISCGETTTVDDLKVLSNALRELVA